MNPLHLTLKGFKGIKAGLGRDEVHIDLSIPGQLVAIAGPNGAGKTTVLDNLHPYRVMPSRASGYGPGNFSYFDQTAGQAKKVLRWEHQGELFESTILIKGTAKTKTQECYLIHLNDDGSTDAVNDGKASTYDAAVEAILGTPEMFFTAAFSCQGRRSLADYSNGDIKALMSELLGMNEVLALGDTARQVAAGAKVRLDAIRERVARDDDITLLLQGMHLDLSSAEADVSGTMDKREVARQAVEAAQARVAEAQAAGIDQAANERRRATLQEQITAIVNRRDTRVVQINRETSERANTANLAISAARKREDEITASMEAIKKRLAAGQALLARRDEIEEAQGKLEAVEADQAKVARIIATMSIELDRLVAVEKQHTALGADLRAVGTEGHALKAVCEALHARATLVDEVPCKGTDLQGKCQLLAEAVTAKGTIPAKEGELETKRAEREAIVEKIRVLGFNAEALQGARSALDTAQEQRQLLDAHHRKYSASVALKAALEAAVLGAAADQQQLDLTQGQLTDAAHWTEQCRQALTAITADKEARLLVVTSEAEHDQALLANELAALPPTDALGLAKAQDAVNIASAILSNADDAIQGAKARLATLVERQANLQAEHDTLQADVAKAERLTDEIAHWTLLAKALGKDGIVALCIDDAGPTLSTICNDLLKACYGPRFSVSIKTQSETKAGALREDFDIVVFDAERGDEKSIRDVSGGERIWINESMTRAIALYQAQTSGRNYECLFSDESDGALDGEKKRQFAAMKRAVLEMGGYKREIFISHSDEVKECADATIDMGALRAVA